MFLVLCSVVLEHPRAASAMTAVRCSDICFATLIVGIVLGIIKFVVIWFKNMSQFAFS